MPLVQMGERLREGRVARGLSVEEVAAQLKISPRLIRDLEAGNEPSLPHAVYVRGFIKSYARLLDVNPEDLAAGLAVYAQVEETPSAPIRVPPRPRSNWGLVLLAVVCAIAFAGYWYYNTYFVPAHQMQPALSPRVEPSAPATSAPPSSAPSPAPSSASQSALSAPAAANASSSSGSGTQAVAASRPQASADAAGEDTPVRVNGFRAPGRELPVTGSGRGATVNLGMPPQDASGQINQLVLTGTAECWVHATADETDTRQFAIQPGETFSLSFSKVLVIKLGNAGGVRLKYNGTELPAPGKEGQVKTLRFPENGPG